MKAVNHQGHQESQKDLSLEFKDLLGVLGDLGGEKGVCL